MLLLPLLLLLFQEPAFQTGVALVHVDAEVTVGGQTVHGLTAGDFRVTDDGQPQQIRYFSPEEQPLDVILLVDVSSSMQPVVGRIASTAGLALSELHSDDRVALMVFSDGTRLNTDFTNDRAQIQQALAAALDAKFVADTRLHHAIDDAALHFLENPPNGRRRAVLVVTDNRATDHPDLELDHLWQADAVLSGLIVLEPGRTEHPSFARIAGMTALAEQTGGETFDATDAGDGFREMMRRLRQRYSMEYAMPAVEHGEQRLIRVELTPQARRRHPGAVVRVRTGYVAP